MNRVLFLCVVSFVIEYALGLPEFSLWEEHITKNTVIGFHKSMLERSEIHAQVYCKERLEFQVSWVLISSPCIAIFLGVNETKLFEGAMRHSSNSPELWYNKGSSIVSCTPSHPSIITSTLSSKPPGAQQSDVLSKIDRGGAHLLILKIDFSSQSPSSAIDLVVKMVNSDGSYLSAVEFPFLPFNGVMSLLYLGTFLVWLVPAICYYRELMRIQFCIGFMIFIGLWEHLTLFAIFETVRKSGQVAPSAVYFAEFIACVKRTLSRLLILVTCLGYGVTKPRLTTIWFRRCLAVGSLYFIFFTMEGMSRVSRPRLMTTRLQLVTILPLSVLDVLVMGWMFVYLARTLRETRMRRNLIKHSLYRHFSYVLMTASLASIAFMLCSIELFKRPSCIKNWPYLWIDEGFWQVIFLFILFLIVILWRPTGHNRQYAYSLLDDQIEDLGEDEEVLLDRIGETGIDSEIRLRPVDDLIPDNKLKTTGTTPQVDAIKGPIPVTLVERIGIEASSGPNEQTPVWKVE